MLWFFLMVFAFFGLVFLMGVYHTYANKQRVCADLGAYLAGCNGKIVVLDVETNGLNYKNSSVLSCSAIKYTLKNYSVLKEVDRFNRFYYPEEPFDKKATQVNGLNEYRIGELRKGCSYVQHFSKDNDFLEFCKEANLFIAHNTAFDMAFIGNKISGTSFCTMKNNSDIVRAKWLENKNEWKWPNLLETANFYSITVCKDKFHESMYDTEITADIFQEMINRFDKKAGKSF